MIIKVKTDLFPLLAAPGDRGQCSGHGFCLGAVAAPWLQVLGGWRCSAFLRCIRTPWGQLSILFVYCFLFFFHTYLSLAILIASCCVVIALACYINLFIVVGYGVMYVVGVAYIIGIYFTSYIGLGSVA